MDRRIVVLSVVLVGSVMILGSSGFAFGTAASSPAEDAGPLKIIQIFTVGGTGGWDYLTADSQAHRLYLSHSTQVAIIDTKDGTSIGVVSNTPGIHGIALVPDCNEGYTSNGRENKLSVFDLKTFKTLRKVDSGRNPDSIIYDPAIKKVFSFNHSGGDITVVDTTAPDKAPVTIQVGGTLETGVSDLAGHVYVNVEDKSEVVAIDSKNNTVLSHWSIAPGEGPTGMAIDREHHRLFSGCGNQMMVVLDPDNGKVLATVPAGSGIDGVAFDPSTGLAVTANGRDGTITVVKEEPTGTFKVVQTLKTARGTRTITVDPQTHLFYLPCNVNQNGQNQFSVIVVGAGVK
jgi:DNA-binding beta-propeller fold protein YncE